MVYNEHAQKYLLKYEKEVILAYIVSSIHPGMEVYPKITSSGKIWTWKAIVYTKDIWGFLND